MQLALEKALEKLVNPLKIPWQVWRSLEYPSKSPIVKTREGNLGSKFQNFSRYYMDGRTPVLSRWKILPNPLEISLEISVKTPRKALEIGAEKLVAILIIFSGSG